VPMVQLHSVSWHDALRWAGVVLQVWHTSDVMRRSNVSTASVVGYLTTAAAVLIFC
jgi:hypothetical protein